MKVGLALGSGAAKGIAHIGVLQALEENEIPVDVISGTSIGAVIGGLYAAGMPVNKLMEFAEEFGDKNLAFWMDPSFFRGGGLIKGGKIEQALREIIGPITFDRLNLPFCAVASDLATGEEVVIKDGEVVRAIRASFAIPGIFSPVKYNDHWLVDGAITAPIPTRILREMKCDVIIAVNVGSLPEGAQGSFESGPKLLDVLMQALAVAQRSMAVPCIKFADVNITPAVWDYGWTEFSSARDLVQEGYRATDKLVPTIKRIISRRRKVFFLRRLFRT